MADSGTLPSGLPFPADDHAEGPKRLAGLIQILRVHADRAGYSDVVAILDDALAAAVDAKPKSVLH